jgi:hypothetical protein
MDYKKFHVEEVQGRYITYDHLKGFISDLTPSFKVENIGTSVRNQSIKSISYGQGPKRILMWSQMHGNESTTTKAVMDLLNYLKQNDDGVSEIASCCTLKIIPILNPDGAKDYTRANANGIDLNRDAQERTQPESIILHRTYEEFNPHLCFNLHDQRTIFNVGSTNKPATVSFLAPAFDIERNNSPTRKISMQLIAAMNNKLQQFIPGQVGRYDDGFNKNCVGDAFQMKRTPTVLFEAGHYPQDYQREKTREFIFYALLEGIQAILKETITNHTIEQYLAIPENGKQYVDILVKNLKALDNRLGDTKVVPIQYKESLLDGKVHFIPEKASFDVLPGEIFGHKLMNCADEADLKWLKKKDIYKLLT